MTTPRIYDIAKWMRARLDQGVPADLSTIERIQALITSERPAEERLRMINDTLGARRLVTETPSKDA
jgi:hypothetical protein